MDRNVEFFFDYISPATYFAHLQLPKIAERTGAEIIYRPFLLGAVFKATGNVSPMTTPAKGAWLLNDLNRVAKRYNIPFELNPHFPFSTIPVLRGAIWIQETGDLKPYSDAVFKAIWAEKRNLADETELAALFKSLSINPQEFKEAISRQEIKDALKANTDEAVQRGAFGAPTMFVGNEMFWGQDRLGFVEEALEAIP